ncbi:hypothetical protein AK812_SmicGene17004 [Symbiodinium microadriaticum]|uniref:Uncharacterized protein n=1 Tax=Symbiodinium microadriaticum TaxID=2951 RepID=A0A1Q9DYX4_SYMMI|nr:hypothetical protein AK812_SmicGene17004 [Symbiodinium microadriaticum]
MGQRAAGSFGAVLGADAWLFQVPADLEVLLSNLSDFTKVFKQHWDDVKKNSQHYERIFSGDAPSDAASE